MSVEKLDFFEGMKPDFNLSTVRPRPKFDQIIGEVFVKIDARASHPS